MLTGYELAHLIRPLSRQRRERQRSPRMEAHYPALLEWVLSQRVAIASMLQRRFPQYCRGPRTTQRQLADLVAMGYVTVLPVRSTGPAFPRVFAVTARGVTVIREAYAHLGIELQASAAEESRQEGRSLQHVHHEVITSEIMLGVQLTIECRPDMKLLFAERRYHRQQRQLRFTAEDGSQQRVVPDAGFLFAAGGRAWPHDFLELQLDAGKLSPRRIFEKFSAYHQWAASPEGERYLARVQRRHGRGASRPNFRLLVVVHDPLHDGRDDERLLTHFTQALALPAITRERVWMTTLEALRRHVHDELPLEAPIWLRVRDARPSLADYRKHMENLPRGSKRFLHQRRFWAERLPQLPRHRLFPYPIAYQRAENRP